MGSYSYSPAEKSTWTIELDVSNSMKKQSVEDVITTITGTQMPGKDIITRLYYI